MLDRQRQLINSPHRLGATRLNVFQQTIQMPRPGDHVHQFPVAPPGAPFSDEGLKRRQRLLLVSRHAQPTPVVNPIAGGNHRAMSKLAPLPQLQPEIPVLVQIKLLVEPTGRFPPQRLSPKQQRMDRNEVFTAQPCVVKRLVVDLHGLPGVARGPADASDAGVGGDGCWFLLQQFDQARQVIRFEPVVIIQKDQDLALGAFQPQIGGGAPPQRATGLRHAQWKAALRCVERRIAHTPRIHQDNLDPGIGLRGQRGQRLGQFHPPGCADDYRDQGAGGYRRRNGGNPPPVGHGALERLHFRCRFVALNHPIRFSRLDFARQGVGSEAIQRLDMAVVGLHRQLADKAG